jgi:hypothetical protein
MKRNWETIREILSRLEDLPRTDSTLQLSDFSPDRRSEISYHTELLIEAGLIEGDMHGHLGPGPSDFFAKRLSWSGHEFLDAVRSDTVWAKTKKTFAAKGVEMTFDLVKSVASEITVALVRGATGV